MIRSLAACAAALLLTACATIATVEAALSAAGMSKDAYCALTPTAREKVRARLHISNQVIVCPNDAAWRTQDLSVIPT